MSGKLTLQVILIGDGVFAEYFANDSWNAPIAKTSYSNRINFDWDSGNIIPGHADNVTAKFYITLKGKA